MNHRKNESSKNEKEMSLAKQFKIVVTGSNGVNPHTFKPNVMDSVTLFVDKHCRINTLICMASIGMGLAGQLVLLELNKKYVNNEKILTSTLDELKISSHTSLKVEILSNFKLNLRFNCRCLTEKTIYDPLLCFVLEAILFDPEFDSGNNSTHLGISKYLTEL